LTSSEALESVATAIREKSRQSMIAPHHAQRWTFTLSNVIAGAAM
jgi:hypothetical protein